MNDKSDEARRSRILVDRVTGDEPLPPNILHVPPRLPDAPVRIDRRPRVSDDPRDVADVRRRWEQEIDALYETALEGVGAGEDVFLEHLHALRQRRDQAIADLRAMMADDRPGSETARARAAHTLWELGEPAGEQFLLDALESPSAGFRKAALAMLREWDLEVSLEAAERARRVLAQFDHADRKVVLAAVDLCAWRKVPGAEGQIAALLAEGRAPEPERVAFALARIATTQESVQALLPHLFRAPPSGYYQGFHFQLERLLAHPDARIREPVRQALHAYARRLTRKLRHQQHVVYDLAVTADAEAIPVLEKIRDRATDPVSRLYALKALASLQPDRAVDLALDFMARDRRYDMAIDVLSEHATPQDADRIIAAVLPPADEETPWARQLRGSVVRLLLKLGERGRQVVAQRLEDVEPEASMEAVWALRGLTLPEALAELHAAGVLPHTAEEALARLAEHRPEDEERPANGHGPSAVLDALGQAGVVTMFDTETGMLPCHHERLICQFAEGTAGRFLPECPVQVWHQENEDDLDAPYTVAFLHRGRVYAFEAENYGDYYDVEAVTGALNFALADAGYPERFVGMAGMGQCACYVFADPAAFLPLADKYGIPVCEDHSAPMRAGRAFEEQVFEQSAEEADEDE